MSTSPVAPDAGFALRTENDYLRKSVADLQRKVEMLLGENIELRSQRNALLAKLDEATTRINGYVDELKPLLTSLEARVLADRIGAHRVTIPWRD